MKNKNVEEKLGVDVTRNYIHRSLTKAEKECGGNALTCSSENVLVLASMSK